ncbi:putative secreted protein [Enhygromyxa salina]|uniref:Putative secreted protein n=1 Tax=Enhygromyxa salina TaxID=215803 RepID=A0A0C2CV58_9BACT|nr:DUF4360 domain-containing protein [Enhygromyxa salina]KIG11752.1 putative secreted protein [Enhygromyxa salina]
MNDPNKKVIARSCVAVILLAAAPACNLDESEEIDDRDMIVVVDAAARDASEELLSPGAGEPLAATPNPQQVYVESVVVNGSGCPFNEPGSVDVKLSPDLQRLDLRFEDMLITAPVDPPGPAISTLNCVVSAKLHVPTGWQFSAAAIETRGTVSLEQGMKVRHASDFFFAGDPGYNVVNNLEGSIAARFRFVNNVPSQSVVWSACGGSVLFGMNTAMVLNAIQNPQGSGTDKVRTNNFTIQWQKC